MRKSTVLIVLWIFCIYDKILEIIFLIRIRNGCMAKLIICSKNKKSPLKDIIKNTLGKHCCWKISEENENSTIVNLKGNDDENVVIVDYNSYCNLNNSKKVTYIISSADKKSIEKMTNTRFPVITCGTSSKDTISLASIDGVSAVVSLQRKIKNLYGEVIEPMDIKIQLNTKTDVYHTLAACTVLLLCGIEN